MASSYSPWFYRKVLYKIPGLFKKCPEGNYHWFWDRLCFCREHQHEGNVWHGGIYDFKTGEEYIKYSDTDNQSAELTCSANTNDLRKAAKCVFLVTDEDVAHDLANKLNGAADMIDELQDFAMTNVRKALWKAYKRAGKREGGIEGKSSEAWCELRYPTYWECKTEEEFLIPCEIMIYSYALGPSRRHYIKRGNEDRQINYYTWESPDMYKKAIEVIDNWCSNE